MTQPPRIRRDPRNPASIRARPAPGQGGLETEERTVLRVDDPLCHVLAVVDLEAGMLSRADRELMGAARHLADALGGACVMVACLPPGGEFRAKPEAQGADRLALLRDESFGNSMPEWRVGAVLSVAGTCAARHLMFPETSFGGELARRIAARLGDRLASGVRRLSAETLVADMDRGRSEVTRPLPFVLVPAPGAFEPVAESQPREARPLHVPFAAPEGVVVATGTLPIDPAAIPLSEADLIIGAGSGVTDWTSFHAAARALGAAEAGSRVVCDSGLLPRTRQVGASGTLVEPRCYLAFGIAGAAQHLQGIAGAERVVAVNTDLKADMIKRADLAIVADAQAVLPALVQRAGERRGAAEGIPNDPGKDRNAA